MKIVAGCDHRWDVTIPEAREIQQSLRNQVVIQPFLQPIRRIVAVDVSYSRFDKLGFAVLGEFTCVYDNVTGLYNIQDSLFLKRTGIVDLPYVPGYLSFREIPMLIPLFEQVESLPDLILVDGAGIAHPRELGLASHLGVIFNIPSIGCAKSRLIGEFQELPLEKGAIAALNVKGKQVGAVLRSKDKVRPLFISPGHLTDIRTSTEIILRFCSKYRIPEPIRQVDAMSKELRRQTLM
ncbi:MAG: endonuclease V [Candidatus Marinimicrobia bacterium CG08_land_8_20_14_0_20_45_22]|nr:MAG: endonuclease V [Candidatus Marinimicrobia bacterium CG08_land_8_20_14_0_20_45_22]